MANTPRLDRIEQNYLINGGMDFPQRIGNATVNLSTSVVYYLDRWLARFNGTYSGTPTIRQEAVSPDNRSLWCTRVDGNASNSAANYEMRQRIESVNCLDMVAEGTASFSAWIYSESATSADLRMFTADASDNFSSVTAFPSGIISKPLTVGQWNLVKWENVAVPVGGVRGIEFRIELNNMTVTGVSKIHRWTQLQAVAGIRAPNFARNGRNISEEANACFRYFAKSINLFEQVGAGAVGFHRYRAKGTASGEIVFQWSVPVMMRTAAPTFNIYSTTGTINAIRDTTGAADISSSILSSNSTGATAWNNVAVVNGSQYAGYFTADAEL